MLVSDIINEVRPLVNDNDSTSYRYSDDDLIIFINSALRRIAVLRPDLFTTVGNIACTAGTTIQTTPNYGRLVEIFSIADGNAVTEVNRETMDTNTPGWRAEAAAAAVNWMRHNRNPHTFFVYPKAPSNQNLLAEWCIPPAPVDDPADTIPLFDGYQTVVVDMTVATVEWSDDERMLSQRAEQFYSRAATALGVSVQNAAALDAEERGADPRQVS